MVDRTFSVILRASGAVYAPFTVQSAVFYWRAGTSGAWTDVPMTPDGARASALIAANTFPAGTVQWYAEATDNTGNTTLTDTYTLSTLTADVQAVPLEALVQDILAGRVPDGKTQAAVMRAWAMEKGV